MGAASSSAAGGTRAAEANSFTVVEGAWEVRNLTLQAEEVLGDPAVQALRDASREHARAQGALELQERNASRLRSAAAAASARAGVLPGQPWSRAHEKVHRQAAEAVECRRLADERLAKARSIVETLEPSTALLEANKELARAHAAALAAAKEEEKSRKALAEARKASELVEHATRTEARLSDLRASVASSSTRLQQSRDAVAPLQRQLEEGANLKEDVPPVTVFIQATQGLRQLSADGGAPLGAIGDLIRCEWVLWLGSKDGDPDDPAAALPLTTVLAALSGDEPRRATSARGETLLAVRRHGAQSGNASVREDQSQAAGNLRYLSVFPEVVAKLREQASRGQPLAPACLELLRVALGLAPGVRAEREVRSAVLTALNPRQVEAPEGLKAKLRPYQMVGFRWLAANADNGIGCLLADEMGLGKTLQTIALLTHLRASGRIGLRPALVVAPFSVLSTWEREIAQWSPLLRCQVYHGAQRVLTQQRADQLNGVDVVLTTYATLQRDANKFCAEDAPSFACIVLDESQAIKNPKSLTARAAKRLTEANSGACIRVALSGTPIENRLSELYSLLDFLNPGFFGKKEDFAKAFERVVQRTDAENEPLADRALKRLSEAIGPLVLRRLKTDAAVAPELPAKLELTHVVALTRPQRHLYATLVEQALRSVTEKQAGAGVALPSAGTLSIEEAGPDEVENGEARNTKDAAARKESNIARQARVLASLHALQQACNHPAALPRKRWPMPLAMNQASCPSEGEEPAGRLDPEAAEFAAEAGNSGKTARLLEVLAEILAPPREKVLIFTQYLATLHLIAGLTEASFPGVRAVRFHGGLSREARDEAAQSFTQDPSCAVMVLTLGAGGVGLTLTAATHVVHFDRCWNPAREAQATDRAHRIGQQRTVVVHRLVTEDTFEVRLATVVAKKRRLAEAALPAGGSAVKVIAECSDEELRDLFRLSCGPPEARKRLRKKAVATEVIDLSP